MSPQLFHKITSSMRRGKWGLSEQGQSPHRCTPSIHRTQKDEDRYTGEKKMLLRAMRLTSKGRKTEQLHLVDDTDDKPWYPGGKPVYLISFLHHLFLCPPLCFSISVNSSIQGFCLFHFLSAICLKSSLYIFYPLPHFNLGHFLL